ncbi:MAG: dTDP-4-dehydrorhamnose 3,5-epimerase [Oscillospiraceae bacterium]
MNKIETPLKDVYILEPAVFGDNRGWFMESWSKREMERLGLFYDFIQDNHSFSTVKGTIRGLHFQNGEFSQAKLVRCARGAVLDVAVDLRKGSPTYKMWTSVVLSAENHRQFLIPRGFAHGFMTLTDEVDFLYRADNFYNKESEGAIRWNDPVINVDWGIDAPVVSEKDAAAPFFDDTRFDYFKYE